MLKFRTPDDDDLIAPPPDIIKPKLVLSPQSIKDSPQTGQIFDSTITELNQNAQTPLPTKRKGYVLTPLSQSLHEESPEGTYVQTESGEELPLCHITLSRYTFVWYFVCVHHFYFGIEV